MTIIVILILSTASINAVLGEDGLMKQAQMMREYQANAEASDRELIDTLLQEYANMVAEDEESEPVVWTYNQTAQTVTNGTQILEIGDYVDYDCKTGATLASYTSPVAKNGYADQTFTLVDYNYGWRVLGVDDEGRLLLISEDSLPLTGGYTDTTSGRTMYHLGIKGDVTKAQVAYLNAVDELNNICAIYGQGEGAESARSVKVEDINKITGYNPETAECSAGNVNEYGNKVTYTLKTDGYVYYQGTKQPTTSKSSGYTTFTYWTGSQWKTLAEEESATLDCTKYQYYPNTLTENSSEDTEPGISTSSTVYKMLFTNYRYYLASTVITTNTRAMFGIIGVKEGYVYVGNFCYSDGSTYDNYRGVRPVVTLSPDITLTDRGTDYDGCTLWNLN